MEERYWLRHPSLSGHQGPYLAGDLKRALEGGAFPMDSYALVDSGQSEDHRLGSVNWRPVTDVLGMEPPPPPSATEVAARSRPPTRLEIRQQLREDTAYGLARRLISILAGVTLVFLVIATVAALAAGSGEFIVVALLAFGLEVLATLAIAAFLQGMLDIADASLRRQS